MLLLSSADFLFNIFFKYICYSFRNAIRVPNGLDLDLDIRYVQRLAVLLASALEVGC